MCQHMRLRLRQHQPSASCASSPLHSVSDASIRDSQSAAARQESVRKSWRPHLPYLPHHRFLKFTGLHDARVFNHLQHRRWWHEALMSEHLPLFYLPSQVTANTMATMLSQHDRGCRAHRRATLPLVPPRVGISYTAGREACRPTTA